VASVLLLLVACAGAPERGAELPEIAAFRAALADPARHPVRSGLEIDDARLREAVGRFRDEHRALLEKRFRASLDALPAGTAPGDGYGVVAETAATDSDALADGTGFMYALNPDASHLARMAISMFAPTMARDAGMSIARIGAWIAFFATAAPVLRRCGGADGHVVCVDYGGLDVFVVTFTSRGAGWGVSGVAWKQRGHTPAPG
jgi:hypothetical protein